MKKCPYCAEEIQNEAIFCRYCNKDIASVSINAPQIFTPPITQKNQYPVFSGFFHMERLFNFTKRANRSEFWSLLFLPYFAIIVILMLLIPFFQMLGVDDNSIENIMVGFLMPLLLFACFVIVFAVIVRRIRDLDRSLWSLLYFIIPLTAIIYILMLLFQDSAET